MSGNSFGALFDDVLYPSVKQENLVKGQIIKMELFNTDGLKLKNGNTERYKRFVIVGFTPDGKVLCTALINSECHVKNPDVRACNILLKQSDYSGTLIHDSWLNCSQLFELDKNRVLKEGKNHGALLEKDYKKVQDCFKNTNVITEADKEYYGLIDEE